MLDRSAPGCSGWWSRHRVEQVLRMVSTTGRGLNEGGLGNEARSSARVLGARSRRPTTRNSSPRPRTQGFDTVFTAEAWGSDAYTPLAWWGRETTRLRLGTSVIQLSARTPTACAMAALTLDHLSGGRHILGLGVSGPQVVEGWYGAEIPEAAGRAPASTSTSCARCGPARRRCTATARTTRCR